MTDEAREARREYKREWARSHPEKVREYNKRYWNKRAATKSAQDMPEDNQISFPAL